MTPWCLAASIAHATPVAPAPWWDDRWKRRAKVDVQDKGRIVPSVAPLVVRGGQHGFASVSDGSDVRFVLVAPPAGDPPALLRFDVEAWDGPWGTAFWIWLPTMDTADAELWMYWGNPAVGPDPATEPAWPPSTVAIWHLSDCSSTACGDAAGVGPALDAEGTEIVEGFAGAGLTADGTGKSAAYANQPAPFTVSMLVSANPTDSGGTDVFLDSETFGLGRCDATGLWFHLDGHEFCYPDRLGPGWHGAMVAFQRSVTELYLDGGLVFSVAAAHDAASLTFGAESDGGDRFDGVVDDIRLTSVAPDFDPVRDWFVHDLLSLGADEMIGPDGTVGPVPPPDPPQDTAPDAAASPEDPVRLIGGRCDCDGVGDRGSGGSGLWSVAGLAIAIASGRRCGPRQRALRARVVRGVRWRRRRTWPGW